MMTVMVMVVMVMVMMLVLVLTKHSVLANSTIIRLSQADSLGCMCPGWRCLCCSLGIGDAGAARHLRYLCRIPRRWMGEDG
jgi:hypothetical protein